MESRVKGKLGREKDEGEAGGGGKRGENSLPGN